jgi:N-acetyl-anhydromuramoyl-L-alanine amidase
VSDAASISSGAPTFDHEGWLTRALQIPSPNCDARPAGSPISLLVVHSISLPPGEFAGPAVVDFFLNRLDHAAHPYFEQIRGLQVSSHFLIRRSGELIQFVPCLGRAWHAGRSQWKGRERCNDFSIGVELEGTDDSAFSGSQYAELARLTRELQRAYPIADIVGHSDIAPGRKTDPGSGFDWARYRSMI